MKIKLTKVLILITLIFALKSIPVLADIAGPVNNSGEDNSYHPYVPLPIDMQVQLSITALVFGLILIIIECYIIIKKNTGWTPEAIRIVGITLVVSAGLYLVPAAYSEAQMAPVIGLLGTTIGYLLGKSEKSGEKVGP